MANVQHNALTGTDLHDAGPVSANLDFTDQASTPTTPATGHSAVYTKSDGLYVEDDAGTVTGPLVDSSGGVTVGTPALTLGTTNAAGSASTVVGTGATIAAFDATAPTTSAVGDSAAAGTATVAARRDHKHGREAFGTTAAAIGTSAGGSATTPSKSDHVHATGAGTPSTQTFGDAAATGTGPAAAMTDHKHAMPDDPTGQPMALTGATSATRYVGGTTSGAPASGTFAVGDFTIDQSGSVWVCTTAGTPGTWTEIAAGGGSAPDVTDGTTTVTAVSTINFTSGATVTDGGSGEADVAISGGSGGISSGTSFPGSPATDDLFFRTDRGLLYYYDGTRWVTVTLYEAQFVKNTTANSVSTAADVYIPLDTAFSYWVTEWAVVTNIGSGAPASQYWTMALYKSTNTASLTQIGSTISTQNETYAQWNSDGNAIGVAIDPATYPILRVDVTKVGSPGVLTWRGLIRYRLVG